MFFAFNFEVKQSQKQRAMSDSETTKMIQKKTINARNEIFCFQ